MQKIILYYTHTCFLDVAVEYIKILSSSHYDVHVLIELAPNQLKTNVINLEVDLHDYNSITSFWEVSEDWKLSFLKPYFEDCLSVNFSIYDSSSSFGNIGKVTKEINQFISRVGPDYIHLDEFSKRQFFLLPQLIFKRKKLILNIHDPKLHTGEFDVYRYLTRKFLFALIPSFVVFSEHAYKILKNSLGKHKHIQVIRLLPYSVFQRFLSNQQSPRAISFVGRVSPYKGIEIFVQAINIVMKTFVDQEFIIAGKSIAGYKPDYGTIFMHPGVKVIDRHLSNKEIVEIVCQSQLIICPYLDATQSGVIMMSYALHRPVLVTNVGGLPEYVISGQTGLISDEISAESLAAKIIYFLNNNCFKNMQSYIERKEFAEVDRQYNFNVIEELYS